MICLDLIFLSCGRAGVLLTMAYMIRASPDTVETAKDAGSKAKAGKDVAADSASNTASGTIFRGCHGCWRAKILARLLLGTVAENVCETNPGVLTKISLHGGVCRWGEWKRFDWCGTVNSDDDGLMRQIADCCSGCSILEGFE